METFDFNTIIPEAYRHLDCYVDNFKKIESVDTNLLWGNPDNTPDPWLSVIVPTYNRSDLLQEALQSVLVQMPVSFSWEVIVVDNTPLDLNRQTPALHIIQQLNDSRILYYHNSTNIGSGYNWNRGVEKARGTWISLLHDDDILYPDALQNIEKILHEKHTFRKPLGYVQARFDEFINTSELSSLFRNNKKYLLELTRLGTLITYYTRTGIPTCGTTILKQAYIETGGINYDFGPTADAVLGYQIMRTYTVLLSDCTLGAYRWGVNETLKLETSQKLVYADYLLAQYCCSQSAFSRLWGKVFGRIQYSRNIDVKVRNMNKLGGAISPYDFHEPYSYQTNPKLRLLFLRAISRFYREGCRMKARLRKVLKK